MIKMEIEKANIQELRNNELLTINGGGPIRDFGAWLHRAWCSSKHIFETDHDMGMPFTA